MESNTENQILTVDNFQDLINTIYEGEKNAICWERKLSGDFSEIVKKVKIVDNITVIDAEYLQELELSKEGEIAREIIINDLKLLSEFGADPVLNLIQCYEQDEENSIFPTDVYSYHVDRSPLPTDTFLCTYYGDPSEIIPNSQAVQKILIPEIREELLKQFGGDVEDFESYLTENFFDLHYQATPEAEPLSLGLGNLWRLAIDHPELRVPPCVHRAPKEKTSRLLLIC
ncbi:MAG: hypothetical protein IPP61_15585 [Cytophagaceae bacterium]|nr:hypothetical protein [Cytophagaceae bacterium]MBK9932560.1 hypothetical protein [Cytophagaceae bacterium]MBL0303756.1 hypothetical protein [Cytophagaceae bacterium]MBL0326579.1 hypothetical protein [Cytophagaceae bacterium]